MIGRWFVGFVVFVGYLCLGAFVFYRIERKEEEKRYVLEILEKLELKGKRPSASKKRPGSLCRARVTVRWRPEFSTSFLVRVTRKIDPNSLLVRFSCPFSLLFTNVDLLGRLSRRALYTTAA